MGAHILLVGEDNFEICKQRGVYGSVLPTTEWNKAEVIASTFALQLGDLVFFYVKNKGVYGLWKVTSTPFYDETRIWPNEQQLYPYRFCFEPSVGYFPRPISLSDILDLHDKSRIWTFDLNPVQQKNQYKITMREAKELIRLLLRNNPIRQSEQQVPEPYQPKNQMAISVDLSANQNGALRYEGWLNAWFMQSFARGELKELFGEYSEFINLVPTTFNKVMDLFLTHVTTVDLIEILHKYTCIELKVDRATDQDLTQLLRYENWLARKLADGDDEMIQSVLIANRFSESVIDYVTRRRRIEEKTIRLITYSVFDDPQRIQLSEVE